MCMKTTQSCTSACCFIKQRVLIASETRTNLSHHRSFASEGDVKESSSREYIPDNVRAGAQPVVEH